MGVRKGFREKDVFGESPARMCDCGVTGCVSYGKKAHDLHQILQVIDSLRGRGSRLEVEEAQEVRCEDGMGREEEGGRRSLEIQGPLLRGPDGHAKEHGLHSRGNRPYCLIWVSVLPLAYVR